MTKNWGRWGDDDQIGTLNLLSPEQVLRCCAEYVRTGEVIPLAHQISASATPNFPPRGGPVHLMAVDGAAYTAGAKATGGCEMADDWIFMPTQTGTHIDALAHVWDEAKLYNGFSRDEVRSTSGAKVCSVASIPPIVGRGVLIDVAQGAGIDRLPGDTRITGDMLEAAARGDRHASWSPATSCCCAPAGCRCGGRTRRRSASTVPGIDHSGGEFLADHDVAAIGADNQSVEAVPWDAPRHPRAAPVHLRVMRDCGIHLFELMNLERLAEPGDQPVPVRRHRAADQGRGRLADGARRHPLTRARPRPGPDRAGGAPRGPTPSGRPGEERHDRFPPQRGRSRVP